MAKTDASIYERFHDNHNRIIDAINRGEWKHSWHLPRNETGYIDWYNDETLIKCRNVLEQERTYGIKIASRADELLEIINEELGRRAKEAELEEELNK